MDFQESQSVPASSTLSLPSPETRHVSMEVVKRIPRILPDCNHMRDSENHQAKPRTISIKMEIAVIDCCCFTPICSNSNGDTLTVCLGLCDFAPLFLSAYLLYYPLSVYRPGSCICLCTNKNVAVWPDHMPIEVLLKL